VPRFSVNAASSLSRRVDLPGLHVTDVTYRPGFATPRHEHEHDCVTVVLDGLLTKELGPWRDTLDVGSVAVTPSQAVHADRFGPDGGRVVVVEVSESSAIEPVATVRARPRVGGQPHLWLTRRIAAEVEATDDAAALALHGLVLELLAAIARTDFARPSRAPAWLGTVVEYLHAHVFERPPLDALAELAGVHRTHLTRVFRAHHGCSIGSYVRRLRVRWAAEQLRSTDASIAEIAARAGFADQSHFSRTFAAYVGVSPGSYRGARHHTPMPWPAHPTSR
jgi:AraC family transcriptional regulator